jgi:hypothetical protein
LLGLKEGNFDRGIGLGSLGNKLGTGQLCTRNFAATIWSDALEGTMECNQALELELEVLRQRKY